MSEWKEYNLGDNSIKIGSGATPRGGSNVYKKQGIALIRSQNVLDLQFSKDGLAYIDEEQADALKNVSVEREDILLNITGDSVARVCKAPQHLLPARVNQHVAIIRTNPEHLCSEYVLYYLINLKPFLLSLSEIGGTRNALTKGMIENLLIFAPNNTTDQKHVADILKSIDDKIDLLHRQNKTLEELSETLFRQWFVEEAADSWEEESLYDSVDLIGGGTPKTSVSEYWNGAIGWLSAGDIANSHRGFVVNSEKSITELGLKNSSARLLPKFSTVITARGTVGKYCMLSEPMTYSQSNYGVLPKYEGCFYFTYLLVAHSVERLLAAAYGTVFDTITTNTFKEQMMPLPPATRIKKFESEVTPLFNKIFTNTKQIRTITQLRDTLLPKLMSGEVKPLDN